MSPYVGVLGSCSAILTKLAAREELFPNTGRVCVARVLRYECDTHRVAHSFDSEGTKGQGKLAKGHEIRRKLHKSHTRRVAKTLYLVHTGWKEF